MSEHLVVEVHGPIVPMKRPRVLHGAASMPRRSVEYQAKIALAVRAAVAAQGWSYRGAVGVTVLLEAPPAQADVDNCAKQALDALVRAKAIADDSWSIVRWMTVRAEMAFTPRMVIEVRPC